MSALSLASAVVYGICTVAIFALLIACCCYVEINEETLRKPFLWLKWAIFFFFLAVPFLLCNKIFDILLGYQPQHNYLFNILPAFLCAIADLFILHCIIGLPLCSLRSLGRSHDCGRIRQWTIFVTIILAVMSITAFCVKIKDETGLVLVEFAEISNGITSGNVDGAWTIIYLAWSLGAAALAVFVRNSSRQERQLRGVSLYLLITAQLNVIRRTWSLYVAIKYQINKQPDIEIPEYVDLVCAILYTSVTVLMFSILVAISRKEAGLRS